MRQARPRPRSWLALMMVLPRTTHSTPRSMRFTGRASPRLRITRTRQPMMMARTQMSSRRRRRRSSLALTETGDLGQEGEFGFFALKPLLAEERGEIFLQIGRKVRLMEADREVFQHSVKIGGVAGLDRIR